MKKFFYLISIVIIAACKKDVPVKVTLNVTTLVLAVGNTETLTVNTLPNNNSNNILTWTSSDPAVATVANGSITAVDEGRAVISVSTENGDKTASCIVIVTTKQMTMTSLAFSVTINLGGLGPVTINWGDGTESETHTLSTGWHNDFQHYTHTYSDGYAHTITITGENIREMDCYRNELISLDVSKNPALKELGCAYNLLMTLDVNNTALTFLMCRHNQLTSLDVSKNTALTTLWCDTNQLTSLDVSGNTELKELSCVYNQLTNLDLSKNTALTSLNCDGNQLTSLDVSKNTMLIGLGCEGNLLSISALDDLIGTLHGNIFSNINKYIYIAANPGTDDCSRHIAEDKGWVVYDSLIKLYYWW